MCIVILFSIRQEYFILLIYLDSRLRIRPSSFSGSNFLRRFPTPTPEFQFLNSDSRLKLWGLNFRKSDSDSVVQFFRFRLQTQTPKLQLLPPTLVSKIIRLQLQTPTKIFQFFYCCTFLTPTPSPPYWFNHCLVASYLITCETICIPLTNNKHKFSISVSNRFHFALNSC